MADDDKKFDAPKRKQKAAPISQDITDITTDANNVNTITTDVQNIGKVVPDIISGFVNIFNGHNRAVQLMTSVYPPVMLAAHVVTPVLKEIWDKWQVEMGDSPLKDHIVESK